MLYKHPGKHEIHGDKFDYIIVDSSDVEKNLKDGWHKTTTDAINSLKNVSSDTIEKEVEDKPKTTRGRPKKTNADKQV